MGKLITVTSDKTNIEGSVDTNEWAALVSIAGLSVVTTFIFPLISMELVEPFLIMQYGQAAQLSQSNILIMIMMLFLIVVLPLSALLPHRRHRHVGAYMGGMTTNPDMQYTGAAGIPRKSELSNYYLEKYFGEKKLRTLGIWLCSGLIGLMLVAAGFVGAVI